MENCLRRELKDTVDSQPIFQRSFKPAETLRLKDCLPTFGQTLKVFRKIRNELTSTEERFQAVKTINDLFSFSLGYTMRTMSKTRQNIYHNLLQSIITRNR